MDGMNILTVLAQGWLLLPNMAKSRAELGIMSGYSDIELAKCLTSKELRYFEAFKK
jgi:hypothetical protein